MSVDEAIAKLEQHVHSLSGLSSATFILQVRCSKGFILLLNGHALVRYYILSQGSECCAIFAGDHRRRKTQPRWHSQAATGRHRLCANQGLALGQGARQCRADQCDTEWGAADMMLHVQYHRTGHHSLYQKLHVHRSCLALAKYSPVMSCH